MVRNDRMTGIEGSHNCTISQGELEPKFESFGSFASSVAAPLCVLLLGSYR